MPSDEVPAVVRKPALIAIDAAREANALVSELTGHQTDLRSLVPMGLAALAVYSAGASKHQLLPRWDNLLYWSYNIFTQLHRREIQEGGGHLPRVCPPRQACVAPPSTSLLPGAGRPKRGGAPSRP